MGNFRLGIFGAGLITRGGHLPAALATRGVEVAALVDPVPERARELAEAYGIRPTIASDAAEVLARLDGAILATPNHTHCELALACAAAGVHVLIEKPLTRTVDEGRQVLDAVRRSGITAGVGYSTRFFPAVELLGRLLAEGHFGRVHRFLYQYGTLGGWAPLSAYTLDRKQSGGGVLVVTATHFLDRMLAWFGYPSLVEYRDDSLGGPEANCWARFGWHGDGLEGEIRLSKTLPIKGGVVLDTAAGRVILGESPAARLALRPAGTSGVEHVLTACGETSDGQGAHRRQLADFVAACAARRAPRISVEQGLESLRLIESLYACRRSFEDSRLSEPPLRQAR